MAYFLVKSEGVLYANVELYYTAIAGGERKFMKMLVEGTAVGKRIFDQILYQVDEGQLKLCSAYEPKEQDLDEAFKHIKSADPALAADDNRVITTPKALASEIVEERCFRFIKIRDLNKPDKYRLLPKLATARVGQCSYVALDAVDETVDKPIIVTIGK